MDINVFILEPNILAPKAKRMSSQWSASAMRMRMRMRTFQHRSIPSISSSTHNSHFYALVSKGESRMSLPTPTELQLKEAVGVGVAIPPSSSSPSWNRLNNHTNPFSSLSLHKRSEQEDSDEDMFTVPDVETTASVHSAGTLPNSNLNPSNVTDTQFQTAFPGKRRRGRNPVDKEYRRLKRLLRNRVSAQQARERKKVYVNDLESRAREFQDKNSKLEERISTLINENTMLRKILMNTRPKADDSIEPKRDQLGKN